MTLGRRRGWQSLLIGLPYLALVLLHLGASRGIERPSIFFDELGYLANARYLAGVAPLPYFPVETPYHFGYSLFLIPIFWWFSNPLAAYRAILTLNALLLSSLYFPLFWLLRRLFAMGVARAAVIALIVCLYPAFVLQSDHAWAENAFIPFYPWTIVVLACFLDRPGRRNAALFGAATGFLYTLHPRALLIPPLVGVGLAGLAWAKLLPRRLALSSLLVMGAVVLGTVMLNRHLQMEISHLPHDAREPHVAAAQRLLSWSGLIGLAVASCGQLLYLLQATYGLFGLGLMFLIDGLKSIWGVSGKVPDLTELSLDKPLDGGDQDAGDQPRYSSDVDSMDHAGVCPLPALPRFGALLFLLLTSLAIFVASSVAMLHPTRSDHILYGRYNEGFLAVYLALALLRLNRCAQLCSKNKFERNGAVFSPPLRTGGPGAHRRRFLGQPQVTFDLHLHPGGMPEISRQLSKATPPDSGLASSTLEGSQTSSTPPGSGNMDNRTPGLGDPGLMSVTPSGVNEKPTPERGEGVANQISSIKQESGQRADAEGLGGSEFSPPSHGTAGGVWHAGRPKFTHSDSGTVPPWLGAAVRDVAVIGLSMFLLTAIVVAAHSSPVLSGSVVDVNILGILPAFVTLARSRSGVGHDLAEVLDLGAITALALVVLALLRLVVTRGFALGMVLLASLFLAVTTYDYQRLRRDQRTTERAASLAERIQEMGPVAGVSYDLSSFDPGRPRCYCLTQYLLGKQALDLFFSGRGELPRSRVVISSRDWPAAKSVRAQMVLEETMTGNALWLLPAAPVGSASPEGYLNVRLGHQPIEGIAEDGFYGTEDAKGEESGRWTNGAARLTVPLKGKAPWALALALGPKAAHPIPVWVRVNGQEVYRGRAGPGSSDVIIPLDGALLGDRVTIEVLSETFVPRERQPGSEDARRLGIFVRGVRLLLFHVDD